MNSDTFSFLGTIPGAIFGSIAVLVLGGALIFGIYKGITKNGKNWNVGTAGQSGNKSKPITLAEKIDQLRTEMYNITKDVVEINEANSTFHFMDKENQENDDHLKQKCQDRVNSMRNKLQNDLTPIIGDNLVVAVVCRTIRMTFQTAIIRNHFTKELIRSKISQYRARILDDLRQDYVALHLMDKRVPSLEKVDALLVHFVDGWLKLMREEVAVCCEEKIAIYQQHAPKFENVKYLKDIVESCIKKNKNYIQQLTE